MLTYKHLTYSYLLATIESILEDGIRTKNLAYKCADKLRARVRAGLEVGLFALCKVSFELRKRMNTIAMIVEWFRLFKVVNMIATREEHCSGNEINPRDAGWMQIAVARFCKLTLENRNEFLERRHKLLFVRFFLKKLRSTDQSFCSSKTRLVAFTATGSDLHEWNVLLDKVLIQKADRIYLGRLEIGFAAEIMLSSQIDENCTTKRFISGLHFHLRSSVLAYKLSGSCFPSISSTKNRGLLKPSTLRPRNKPGKRPNLNFSFGNLPISYRTSSNATPR